MQLNFFLKEIGEKHLVKSCTIFLSKLLPPDIYDAAYSFSSEEMNMLGLPPSALQKKGLFIRLIAFFYWFAKHGINEMFSKKNLDNYKLTNKTVFFYSSHNEKSALGDIATITDDAITVSSQLGESNKIKFFIPYLLSLIYAPWVIFKYFDSSDYQKKSFSYAFDQYLFACGYIIYLRFTLSNNRPLLAVVTNDHSMLGRSFALVCRELNIPIAYIQHASVSNLFPKLIFNYAFLDGADALAKYSSKGLNDCKILLSGIPKLDKALKKLQKITTRCNIISISSNSMDPVDKVIATAQYIKENIGQNFNVCIRPHPGDGRRFKIWQEKAEQIGVSYSNPEIESSLDLILKSTVMIAADSNILLEAALLKTKPICTSFTGQILDHYGFIQKGIAQYAENKSEIVALINNMSEENSFYHKAKYFSHTVETMYEGSSASLIASTLNSIAQRKNIPDFWCTYSKSVYEAVRCL